jgi:prepilin-type N-terminal cleavage/methylation domain-containing protein/prepilin-type processing-associated H-X9-DG protein
MTRMSGTAWHGGLRRALGFTLIELLIVVAIIALLISILLPSLSAAREQAQKAKCMANLNQFGRGFFTYATENNDYLCSGQTDPRYGTNYPAIVQDWEIMGLHRVGWVADLVNAKLAFPGKMLCPTSYGRQTQSLNRIPRPDRPQLVEYLKKNFYNTNYTQSWYMVHTGPSETSTLVDRTYPFPTIGAERVNQGPLRLTSMVRAAPGRVPLLGDPRSDFEEHVVGSSQLESKSVTDGPRWHYGSTGARSQFEYNATNRWMSQDFDDFGVAHVRRGRAIAGRGAYSLGNILFGDGHVRGFVDKFTMLSSGQTIPQPDGLLDGDDFENRVFDGVLSLGRRSARWDRLQ